MKYSIIYFLCAFLQFGALEISSAKVYSSEVVATIGKEVVTSRMVLADGVIEAVQTNDKQFPREMKVTSDRFNEELNRYLLERIIYLESKSFSAVHVEKSKVEALESKVKAGVQKSPVLNEVWRELAIHPDELKELIQQKTYSRKFIEFKSKSSFVSVTEREINNYYKNNKSSFQGHDLDAVKDLIKKKLEEEQAEQRLSDWYDILKKKYDVVKTISFH